MFVKDIRLLAILCLLNGHLHATGWQVSEIDKSAAYWLDFTTRNFTTAQKFCEQHGGRILKLTDSKVESYIRSKYLVAGAASRVWLDALQKVKNSKVFRWQDDGSIVNFTLGNGGSDYKYYNCVGLSLSRTFNVWWDYVCMVHLQVICEKRLTLDFTNVTSTLQLTNQTNGRQLATDRGLDYLGQEMMTNLGSIGLIVISCIALFGAYVILSNRRRSAKHRPDLSEQFIISENSM